MTKEDISLRVSSATGLNYAESRQAVQAVIDTLKQAIQHDPEGVKLRQFGTFTTRDKNARDGRNPKTGEYAQIPERTVVRFKAGDTFKRMVNNGYKCEKVLAKLKG